MGPSSVKHGQLHEGRARWSGGAAGAIGLGVASMQFVSSNLTFNLGLQAEMN
jgi:hypothetical protein